jgi:transcriptional regulator with XRE-family HTH domain
LRMQALHKQIGQRIRDLRANKGISQEALASICNLHRTYIGLIERGERNLSISTVEVIAQGLEVSPSELFVGTEVSALPAAPPSRKPQGTATDVEAHLAAIRQILIDAKLTDARRYEALYKALQKKKP